MNAVIYHTFSKNGNSKKIAESLKGDYFQIEPVKPVKNRFFAAIKFGFKQAFKMEVPIKKLDIDFAKYEEITLISPVWGGSVNIFMKQFLQSYPFHDKKVTIIATGGGKQAPNKYFDSYKGLIDGCCEIVAKQYYSKDQKQ
jgi:hypothetical protein